MNPLSGSSSIDYRDRLGIQLWSLRDQTKTDLPGALDLVKGYGLTEVETAGTGDLPAADFLKLLTQRGLKPVSAHVSYEALQQDLPGAIRTAKTLGVKFVITPWLPQAKTGLSAAAAREIAANFNRWGEAFRAEGIRYGYHPHGFEFVALPEAGSRSAFEIFMQNTKPEWVTFEMDVFWAVHAGQDPVALLEKHRGRWSLMHVKDIRKGAVTGLSTGSAPPTDNVVVGTGQIDWPALLRAAREAGIEHYFLEDETPSPLVCIPASLKYLRNLKL